MSIRTLTAFLCALILCLAACKGDPDLDSVLWACESDDDCESGMVCGPVGACVTPATGDVVDPEPDVVDPEPDVVGPDDIGEETTGPDDVEEETTPQLAPSARELGPATITGEATGGGYVLRSLPAPTAVATDKKAEGGGYSLTTGAAPGTTTLPAAEETP